MYLRAGLSATIRHGALGLFSFISFIFIQFSWISGRFRGLIFSGIFQIFEIALFSKISKSFLECRVIRGRQGVVSTALAPPGGHTVGHAAGAVPAHPGQVRRLHPALQHRRRRRGLLPLPRHREVGLQVLPTPHPGCVPTWMRACGGRISGRPDEHILGQMNPFCISEQAPSATNPNNSRQFPTRILF